MKDMNESQGKGIMPKARSESSGGSFEGVSLSHPATLHVSLRAQFHCTYS